MRHCIALVLALLASSLADGATPRAKAPVPQIPIAVTDPVSEKIAKPASGADERLFEQFENANAELLRQRQTAYAQDTKLRRYEVYRDMPSQWLSHNYNDEINAVLQFDREKGEQGRKTLNDLRKLYAIAVTSELNSNAVFAELLFAANDTLSAVFSRMAGAGNAKPIFTVADNLIQLPPSFDKATESAATMESWRVGYDKRHRYCMEAIANIAQTNQVPAPVLSGIQAKSVYSTLTTAVDVYLQTHTPAELQKARKEQHRALLNLINAGYKPTGIGR